MVVFLNKMVRAGLLMAFPLSLVPYDFIIDDDRYTQWIGFGAAYLNLKALIATSAWT